MNIMKSKSINYEYTLPLPVRRVLRKLGQDIRDARLRRRIPTAILSKRASISRTTLNKLENGEPGVSIGIVTKVLFVLGLHHRLADLVDIRNDEQGIALEQEHLPKRIHRKRRIPPKEKP